MTTPSAKADGFLGHARTIVPRYVPNAQSERTGKDITGSVDITVNNQPAVRARMDDVLGHSLEEWLPQEPWQGPPLPEFLDIYWPWYTPPAAGFSVSNLVISPEEVNPGHVVTISCMVTNIGSEAGSYIVKLGGDFMAEQTVTLQPGESKNVSFEVTPTAAKTYSVSVDGLSGSFRAVTTPVADIRVENLIITPSEVYVGQPVQISVTATNYGSASGSKVIICNVT